MLIKAILASDAFVYGRLERRQQLRKTCEVVVCAVCCMQTYISN